MAQRRNRQFKGYGGSSMWLGLLVVGGGLAYWFSSRAKKTASVTAGGGTVLAPVATTEPIPEAFYYPPEQSVWKA